MCPNLACQRILTVPVHRPWQARPVPQLCSMTVRIPSKKQPAETEAE